MTKLTLSAHIERWPIRGSFTIARGSKKEAVVVAASVSDGECSGFGECTPYARYGETPEGVLQDVLALSGFVRSGGSREALLSAAPRGAARNAVDCALWDYEAKRRGVRAFEMAGRTPADACTAYTISLGTPDIMAEAAAQAAQRYPLLKVKLGGGMEDAARVAAVREAAPEARLIVDANEAWTADLFDVLASACAAARVEVIEQPFRSADDELLRGVSRPVPICADESVFTAEDLPRLAGLYDAVNIKLDKAGGLTAAMALADAAKQAGLSIMLGCMVATSLAMAPALVLAQDAAWVDLDGPLLLERDRTPGLVYRDAIVSPALREVWG